MQQDRSTIILGGFAVIIAMLCLMIGIDAVEAKSGRDLLASIGMELSLIAIMIVCMIAILVLRRR